jgi:hypothetical protein
MFMPLCPVSLNEMQNSICSGFSMSQNSILKLLPFCSALFDMVILQNTRLDQIQASQIVTTMKKGK